MSHLTNFIEKKYSRTKGYKKNISQNSIYYNINRRTIRISDHFASNSSCNLCIVIPTNSKSNYIVYYGDKNQELYNYNFQDLKIIIENFMYFIKYKPGDIQIQSIETSVLKKVNELLNKFNRLEISKLQKQLIYTEINNLKSIIKRVENDKITLKIIK